jgi:DNA-directed RNA polymerase subunit D
MKVKILNKTKSEIQFVVEGVSPAFANSLRRVMMVEVPTMAIEWVDFIKNDSALNDEILAHRLGLVPLTFNPKAYNLPIECECKGKGCSRCQVKLKLKKEGPCTVYSGDLESEAEDVKPVFDKIPIVELFEGEKLELEATAQLGVGRDHVKWQAAVVGYKNKPKKEISRKEESRETEYIEDTFIFNVESVCGLEAEEIVIKACEVLEDKLKEFIKQLKKLE